MKIFRALVTEAQDTIEDVTDSRVFDVALVGAGQQVEHHEIAVYGTLHRWATLPGLSTDAQALESILNDEEHADKVLGSVADRVSSDANELVSA